MKKVAIFGVPRSGTSWLSQIFNSHPNVAMRFQPLFSFGHKGKLTEYSSRIEINRFYDEILCSQDPFVLMNTEIHKNYPVFDKSTSPTHIAFKETRYLHIIENMLNKSPDIKVIGIVRNPLATLASWILAPKEFDKEWDVHREWRTAPSKNKNKKEEFYGFDKWKLNTENFIKFEKMYPKQFYLVCYNRLKMSTNEITKKLFKFCNIQMHTKVNEFITASKSVHDDDPYSVFRCNANDDGWKNILPHVIIQDILREISGSFLEKFLECDECNQKSL